MELRLDRVTKQYGNKLAVDHVSAALEEGVYGLLGANGAGKTTLMRLICDIQLPTAGEVLLNGQSVAAMGEEYRDLLGYLPQHFGYYPDFSGRKFMMYLAALKGLGRSQAAARTEELLELTGLLEVQNKKIKTYSGGMKQRLGIAQALLNDPVILVLDEPTAGLDPKERVRFRNLISSISKNKIVLLSTHIVSDVEYIAGDILLMKNGTLMHQGAPEEIVKEIEGKVWELSVEPAEADAYMERYNVGNLKNEDGKVILRIIAEDCPKEGARQVSPNLEDLYLYQMQEEKKGGRK